MKVGKVIAISVGGAIILVQIASNEGYINVDWNKIERKANKLADKAEEAISGEGPSWADKVSCHDFSVMQTEKVQTVNSSLVIFQIQKYMKENSYAATSFVGGFLIGTYFS